MLCTLPLVKRGERLADIPPLCDVSEYIIDINTADETELCFLHGLGEVTARSIIDYRTEHGAFKNVNELDNVYGIGDKKLFAWREFITVGN